MQFYYGLYHKHFYKIIQAPNITRCDPESRGDLHDLLCRLLAYRITHQLADTTLPKITQLNTTEGKGDTHHQADSTATNTTGMLTSDLQTQRCRRYASRLPCHKHYWHHSPATRRLHAAEDSQSRLHCYKHNWHHHQQHADFSAALTMPAPHTSNHLWQALNSNSWPSP